MVGLGDRADDRVGEYSGGMQRRCNIAAGLLHDPDLLVLDEPTVGVDPQSRAAILDSIEDLAGVGLAVVDTTHYMEEAERLCDRIGIIDDGRLVAEGSRAELVRSIGEHDRVRIVVEGDVAAFAAWCREHAEASAVAVAGGTVTVAVDDGSRQFPRLLEGAVERGVVVIGVEVVQPDLEDVFLSLTGRALRDH